MPCIKICGDPGKQEKRTLVEQPKTQKSGRREEDGIRLTIQKANYC